MASPTFTPPFAPAGAAWLTIPSHRWEHVSDELKARVQLAAIDTYEGPELECHWVLVPVALANAIALQIAHETERFMPAGGAK